MTPPRDSRYCATRRPTAPEETDYDDCGVVYATVFTHAGLQARDERIIRATYERYVRLADQYLDPLTAYDIAEIRDAVDEDDEATP